MALHPVFTPLNTRASQPFPTTLRTWDALHLAIALLWSQHTGTGFTLATRDAAVARAAEVCGLSVIGV